LSVSYCVEIRLQSSHSDVARESYDKMKTSQFSAGRRCGSTDAEAVSTVHDTKRCVSRRPRGRAKLVCVIHTCTVRSIGI